FAHDEVDARIDRPAHLLFEHRAHRLVRCGIRRIIDVGVADIAGEERAALRSDRLGQLEGAAIDRLEVAFAADYAQLLAMRVISQRLDDIRSGMDEITM